MSDQQGDFIAVGEGLEPHDSNPDSVQHDVEKAMKAAQEAAEKVADEGAPKEPDAEPIDFNKAKEASTPLGDDTPPAEEPETDEQEGYPGDQQISEPGDLEPPAAWSADDQTIFRDCPKDVQEWLLARDTAAQSAAQQQLTAVEPLARVQQQWQPYTDKHGLPFDQAVHQVMSTEMILRTGTAEQKRQAVQHLIQTYDVDFGQPQMVPDELANDPVASAITPQLQQVMEGLNRLQSQVDARFQTMQQSQESAQQAALTAFADATDEKGQKLRPYFSEVRDLMEVLASQAQAAGRATTMEEVYDQACRASPTVWPKIQAAQQSASLRERRAKAAEKQRAASSVSSSPSSGRTGIKDDGNPDESVYETALRAYNAHSGGAA